jgi:hypothetical protein
MVALQIMRHVAVYHCFISLFSSTYFSDVVEKFEWRKWEKKEDLGPRKKERGEKYGKKE